MASFPLADTYFPLMNHLIGAIFQNLAPRRNIGFEIAIRGVDRAIA
jgi:hypothetical protein